MRDELKARRDEKVQKVRDENKNMNCTFTPKINEISQLIAVLFCPFIVSGSGTTRSARSKSRSGS